MFPLNTDTFPATTADLAQHLNDSLRELFNLSGDPVELCGKSYPHLESLIVSLDGAVLPDRPPERPSVASSPEPALTIDSFGVSASPLCVGPALVEFKLAARNVALHRALDRSGHLLLLLHNAANGRVEISAAVSDLEALIAEVAKAEAGRHGVNIDGVQLSLRSRSPRSLAAEVRLRAKKLFVSASLRITGQLDLDEELNARIDGLDCIGDGAIASVACGILKPHLQKLDGREFSLMSLPLGEVRLRDVRIALGEKLSVSAEFGSAA
ncbi:MAG: hypothetical protein ABR611_04005 [Chthoniobacterales bacterium]